ncbi:MAG: hypothetical protein CL608_06265 [Anaerolineaceae bacterium]|nr:hypothetical protein [Anaerolineaceae bacterium]
MYWLKERLRDAWLWPLNLVRDFPARSGRLATTLLTGGKILLLAPLFLWRALGQRPFRQEVRHWARQTAVWLHLLLVQLFDLAGGPEICQFVMHLGMHTTPLTAAEITAVQSMFGPKNLRYREVRIAQGGILNLIFRYNGGLAFATWYTVHLPSVEENGDGNSRANLALLVHELTHVFQYHHVGSRYLGEAIYYLITTQRNCYQYGGAAGLQSCTQQGKLFRQFNREQQAQIVQDYFVKIQEEQDVSAYLPYLVQMQKRDL